jgi:hypothetical protein
MRRLIYLWAGDYFCPGCLIYAMVQHPPWDAWLDEHEVSDFTTAGTLDGMARLLNIETAFDRASFGFPTVVRSPQETIFCCTCLNLLHQAP